MIGMTDEYSKHSAPQQSLTLYCVPKFLSLLDSLYKTNPEIFVTSPEKPFTIMDLGCADGTNSILLLQTMVQRIREINPFKKIFIYLNDLPTNNFDVTLENIKRGLENFNNITFLTVAKSFYSVLVPLNSIDLCYSTMSIHWLFSKAPCIHDGFWCYLTKSTRETPQGKQFCDIGKKDWKDFLEARSKELKSGGLLAVGTFATTEPLSPDDIISLKHCQSWKVALRDALAEHGLQEYEENVTLPVIVRQNADYIDGFFEDNSENRVRGMELIQSETFPVIAPLYKKFSENHKNIEMYCQDYAMFIKACTLKYFSSGLREKGVESKVIESFLNTFYEDKLIKYMIKVVSEENGYSTVTHNLIVVRKV